MMDANAVTTRTKTRTTWLARGAILVLVVTLAISIANRNDSAVPVDHLAIAASPQTAPAPKSPTPLGKGSGTAPTRRDDHEATPGVAPGAGRSTVHSPASLAVATVAGHFDAVPGKRLSVVQLATDFDRLAGAANDGDALAQRALYNALKHCADVPATRVALQLEIDRIRRPGSAAHRSRLGVDGVVALNEAYFERCGEVDARQRASLPHWTALLAAQGDPDARLDFRYVNRPRDVSASDYAERSSAFITRATGYLEAEIARGNSRALLAMGQQYLPARSRDYLPLFPPDAERAYAYHFAYAITTTDDAVATLASGVMARLSDGLTNEQIAKAQSAGDVIAQTCCR